MKLKCTNCNNKLEGGINLISTPFCDKCGSIFDIEYDCDEFDFRILKRKRFNVWKYRELLPLGNNWEIISLSEGGTPLIKAKNLCESLNLKNLYLKVEITNPTGSFKDRSSSLSVTIAKNLEYKKIVVPTTGNVGTSMAAYSARGGIKILIFVPTKSSEQKIAQMLAYGAEVVKVKGTISDCLKKVQELKKKEELYTHPIHVRNEAKKTIAYEVLEQLNWEVPDFFVHPVGTGCGAVGIWKGVNEMYNFDLINELPRICIVQARGCAPIVKAYQNREKMITPIKFPLTKISAIKVPNPACGNLLLKILYKCNGLATSISDREIFQAQEELARKEGIFAEPAGAAPIAGIKNLVDSGKIDKSDLVVAIITGHGLKKPPPIYRKLIT